MLAEIVKSRLLITPDPGMVVLVFFTYSFLGYVLECIVLTAEKKRIVLDRGFVSHLPFCVIYGFGAMAGFALLYPIRNNFVLLFLVGAVGATIFEYLVAQLQIRLFGDFWWDYSEKPFNFKGILCLESTIGWGLAALLVLHVLHYFVVGVVARVPMVWVRPLAGVLLALYIIDFVLSARAAARAKQQVEVEESSVFTEDGRV